MSVPFCLPTGRWHRARLLPIMCAIGALAHIQPIQAASLHAADRDLLTHQAARSGGLMSVMVTIEELSLDAIRARGLSIRTDVEKTAIALRAQLGNDALEAGYWNNGMGQIGLIVTASGLRMLEQSAQVKDIQPDVTRNTRDKAWLTQEDREAIEEALNAKGTVEVELALNSDIDYQLGERGETLYRVSAEAATAQARSLSALTVSPASSSLQIVDDALARAGASALVRARVDWPAYYALRVAPEVRALRLPGRKNESSWPVEVLEAAAKQGEVEVIISLHGAEGYSPNEGYMSEVAWKNQRGAHEAVFDKLLADAGVGRGAQPQLYSGIGALSVRLSAQGLNALYAKKDARVKSISLNKPVASVNLTNSTQLMNMPAVWSAGFRAAGQFIFVLDTGVRKTHIFFRNVSGGSRVVAEACFGTNGSGFKSICPSPNGSGDSPIGLAGSAQPYSNINPTYCSYNAGNIQACNHGTHVAGIATGRAHSSLTPSGIQGVAPDASLIPIQVFSYPSSSSSMEPPTAFDADILAALNATYAETVPGVNPAVVNMSLGGKSITAGNCDSWHPEIATKISWLHSRGVPVVVSTGNDYSRTGIKWPACVSKTIKVSAVNNDSTGMILSSYANIANWSGYTGPLLLAPGGPQNVRSSAGSGDAAMYAMSGTSMAAPHVTGMYAAVKAAFPSASVDDVTAMALGSGGSMAVPVSLPSGSHVFRRVRISP